MQRHAQHKAAAEFAAPCRPSPVVHLLVQQAKHVVSVHQVQHRLHRRPGGALEEALAQVREGVAAGRVWSGLGLSGCTLADGSSQQQEGDITAAVAASGSCRVRAPFTTTHPPLHHQGCAPPVHDEHLVDVALTDVAVQELHKVRHHLGHGRGAGKAALHNRRRQRGSACRGELTAGGWHKGSMPRLGAVQCLSSRQHVRALPNRSHCALAQHKAARAAGGRWRRGPWACHSPPARPTPQPRSSRPPNRLQAPLAAQVEAKHGRHHPAHLEALHRVASYCSCVCTS